MTTTRPTKTYKATLKYQDPQAVEDALLHYGKARKLGIDPREAQQRRDDSVRYRIVFIEARNEGHAYRVATDDEPAGWSVLDMEEMDWDLANAPNIR